MKKLIMTMCVAAFLTACGTEESETAPVVIETTPEVQDDTVIDPIEVDGFTITSGYLAGTDRGEDYAMPASILTINESTYSDNVDVIVEPNGRAVMARIYATDGVDSFMGNLDGVDAFYARYCTGDDVGFWSSDVLTDVTLAQEPIDNGMRIHFDLTTGETISSGYFDLIRAE